MNVTMEYIARMANVSKATVSRVINNRTDGVGDETRKKVLEILDQFDYKNPHPTKNLLKNKSKTIGIIIPDITNSFFAELVKAVDDYLSSRGYVLLLCNTDSSAIKENNCISVLTAEKVEGVILVSTVGEQISGCEQLKKYGIPYVLLDRKMKTNDACMEPKTICKINKSRSLSFADIGYVLNCARRYKSPRYVQGQEDKTSRIGCSFSERLILKATWMEFHKAMRIFQECDFGKVHCIVVHNDLWLCESALIKHANSTNKITVVAEHALCPVNVTEKSINVLNYWHSPSCYLMAWGLSSEKLYKRYSPQLMVTICGNPLLEKNDGIILKKTVGVILDIVQNVKENRAMIAIVQAWAKTSGYYVRIRIHPTDSVKSYQIDERVTSFNREVTAAEFLVGHTSTMLVTCLAEGKKVFRYKSNMAFYDLPREVCFSTQEELSRCVYSKSNVDFANIAKEHIDCIGIESVDKYTAFFHRIRNENWS